MPESALKEAIGKNPYELLFRDYLGAGLQMAIWDVAARQADVPVHALLGRKVRDAVPIGWWCIDMPPEDWAEQAGRAVNSGYTDMKIKCRPWRDIVEQVGAVCDVVPDTVKLDVDFNGFLLDFENARVICRELEKHQNVVIFETPIPQWDVDGNRRLREDIRSRIAHHFGDPLLPTVVREGVCDGFVIGSDVRAVRSQASTAKLLGMPFWLQMVGTGITTTFANHLGAVLSQATWPAITCLNLYSHQLLVDPIAVLNRHITVTDEPGPGIELDEDAMARYRVEPPVTMDPPRWLHEVRFEGGPSVYYRNPGYRADFYDGNLPPTQWRVTLDTWHDDGSDEFANLYAQSEDEPVHVDS